MLILLLAFALICCAAAIDVRLREIPDWIPVLLLGTGAIAAWLGLANVRWWMLVSGALLGFVVGYLMFRFGHFGGGDAKLIAAIGALLGPLGLWFFLFWMALAGGVLALVAVARGEHDYAYGPAIAFGFAGYLVFPAGILSLII